MESVFMCWEHVAEEDPELRDHNLTFLTGKEKAVHIDSGVLFNQKKQNYVMYVKNDCNWRPSCRKAKRDSEWKLLHVLLYSEYICIYNQKNKSNWDEEGHQYRRGRGEPRKNNGGELIWPQLMIYVCKYHNEIHNFVQRIYANKKKGQLWSARRKPGCGVLNENRHHRSKYLDTCCSTGGCLRRIRKYDFAGGSMFWGIKRLVPFWVCALAPACRSRCCSSHLPPCPHSAVINTSPSENKPN